jgi:hypothetical protein
LHLATKQIVSDCDVNESAPSFDSSTGFHLHWAVNMRISAIQKSSYKMVSVMWILHKGISLVHHWFIISHVVKKNPHTYQTSNVAEYTHHHHHKRRKLKVNNLKNPSDQEVWVQQHMMVSHSQSNQYPCLLLHTNSSSPNCLEECPKHPTNAQSHLYCMYILRA